MASSRRVAAVTAAVLVCAMSVGLTGCFAASPTSSTATGTQPGQASPSATPHIFAQMTIASVDVNGKNVTVSGYVGGVIETGGKCTYVATDTATSATVDIPGASIANVVTTSCGTSKEPIGSFAKGSWKVALHYKSTSADVTSAAIDLEIP